MKRTTKGTIVAMILAFSLTFGIIGIDAASVIQEYTHQMSILNGIKNTSIVTQGWTPKHISCQFVNGSTGVSNVVLQTGLVNSSSTFANAMDGFHQITPADTDTKRLSLPLLSNTPKPYGKAFRFKCETGCDLVNTITPLCTFMQ